MRGVAECYEDLLRAIKSPLSFEIPPDCTEAHSSRLQGRIQASQDMVSRFVRAAKFDELIVPLQAIVGSFPGVAA